MDLSNYQDFTKETVVQWTEKEFRAWSDNYEKENDFLENYRIKKGNAQFGLMTLTQYCGSSTQINLYLRMKERLKRKHADIDAKIQKMDQDFDKAVTIDTDIFAYRFVQEPVFNEIATSSEYTEKGYISASLVKDFFITDHAVTMPYLSNYMLRIAIPAGHKALYTSLFHNSSFKYEYELILPRNSVFTRISEPYDNLVLGKKMLDVILK
jgi:hypothetical protein